MKDRTLEAKIETESVSENRSRYEYRFRWQRLPSIELFTQFRLSVVSNIPKRKPYRAWMDLELALFLEISWRTRKHFKTKVANFSMVS